MSGNVSPCGNRPAIAATAPPPSVPAPLPASHRSTISPPKPLSFRESFCNNRLVRAIAQIASNILSWLRSTRLGACFFGPNPSPKTPMAPPLQASTRSTPTVSSAAKPKPVTPSPQTSTESTPTVNSAAKPKLEESPLSTKGLALQYASGTPFNTCIVNGEKFALINEASLKAQTFREGKNITIRCPEHHLVLLDPICTHTLTLEGKSVTILTSLTLRGDWNVTVPKDAGNIIIYGGNKIGVQGKGTFTTKNWIQKGSRVVTYTEGQTTKKVDYLQDIGISFWDGIWKKSPDTIARALLLTGHEVLFSEGQKVSRSDIFKLWGIPLEYRG